MKRITLDDVLDLLFEVQQKLNEKEEMDLWLKVDKAVGSLNIIKESIERLLN